MYQKIFKRFVLTLVVTFLVSCSSVFAAQYELIETYSQGKNYLDLDSIKKDANNPNLIYYTVKLQFFPKNNDSNTEDYALERCSIDVQKQEVKYLEYKSYNSVGRLLATMPIPIPAERFRIDDQYYQKIIQIANGNGQSNNNNNAGFKSGSFNGIGKTLDETSAGKKYKLDSANKIILKDLYGDYPSGCYVVFPSSGEKALYVNMTFNTLTFSIIKPVDGMYIATDEDKILEYEHKDMDGGSNAKYQGTLTIEQLGNGMLKVTVTSPLRQAKSFNVSLDGQLSGQFTAAGLKGNVSWQ